MEYVSFQIIFLRILHLYLTQGSVVCSWSFLSCTEQSYWLNRSEQNFFVFFCYQTVCFIISVTSRHLCVLTVFCGHVSKPTNDLMSKKKKKRKENWGHSYKFRSKYPWTILQIKVTLVQNHHKHAPVPASRTDSHRRGGQQSLSTLLATSSVALPALTNDCFWSKLLANVTQLPTQVNIRAAIMHLGFVWVGTRGVSAGLISSQPSHVTTKCLN